MVNIKWYESVLSSYPSDQIVDSFLFTHLLSSFLLQELLKFTHGIGHAAIINECIIPTIEGLSHNHSHSFFGSNTKFV